MNEVRWERSEVRGQGSEVRCRERQERHALVCDNLRLVTHIAKRYAGRGLELDDLIQSGCIGLMYAARRFDARGNRFSTYAAFWIRREIVRAIENESRTIRLPAWMQRDAMRRDECARYEVCSLDEPTTDGGATLADLLVDDALTPYESIARDETRREVAAMLRKLNPREREIVALRFGLSDYDEMNLPQIGNAIGLSKQRVHLIERKALNKMRAIY